MKKYSDKFKARMVSRMLGERRISANILSQEVGISQPTLSRWLKDAGTIVGVTDKKKSTPTGKSPEAWSPQEKLQAISESAGIADADLGAWLRRNGLKEEHLRQWREQALSGIAARPSRVNLDDRKKVQTLEKELTRKDKALAETAALLVLQGKMQALWAVEDDATRQSNAELSSRALRRRKQRGRP